MSAPLPPGSHLLEAVVAEEGVNVSLLPLPVKNG